MTTTDRGNRFPTTPNREVARRIQWTVPEIPLFRYRNRRPVLTPFGWCFALGACAMVAGAGLALTT